MTARIKFSISPDVVEYPPDELVARAKQFEDAGFDVLWEGDHTLPWHHTGGHCGYAAIVLEAYLQATKRVACGFMVLSPIGIRHHPVDVALTTATMAVLHPGRVALCVGTGEAMNEKTTTGLWPSPRERVERTEEAIQLIKKCWTSNDYFNFRGKYFNSFFYLYDRPNEGIPLICAANGPRMAEVAGKYCDGFVAVGQPPYVYRNLLIPKFEAAARQAGRNVANLEKCAWVSTFYHPDLDKAFAAARRYGGLLIPECYDVIQDPRVIEARANLISDKALAEAFNIASNPDELIKKFEAYVEVGVNHLIWAEGSPDGSLTPKVCGEKIIPYLKQQYK